YRGSEAEKLSRRSMIRHPTLRTPTEGRTIAVVGDLNRFLATGDDTNGKYARQIAVPPQAREVHSLAVGGNHRTRDLRKRPQVVVCVDGRNGVEILFIWAYMGLFPGALRQARAARTTSRSQTAQRPRRTIAKSFLVPLVEFRGGRGNARSQVGSYHEVTPM